MTDLELAREIVDLRARNMAQRQIIARLLWYLAASSPDPEAVWREFTTSGDDLADGGRPQDAPELAVAELMRRETDFLIALAKEFGKPA